MQKPKLTRFWLHTLIAVFAQCLAYEAPAQSYPIKPVYLVVGSSPGGGIDTIARLLAPKLSQLMGSQPMIVENRVGAAQAIATDRVAKSPADGYALLMITSTIITTSVLRLDLPYNLERDLAPVALQDAPGAHKAAPQLPHP